MADDYFVENRLKAMYDESYLGKWFFDFTSLVDQSALL